MFNFKDGFQTTDIIYHWGMKNGSQDSSALTMDSSIELINRIFSLGIWVGFFKLVCLI